MTLLLASALKSCVLLLPALAVARVLRSAALCHAVLAAAFASAAALPLLSLVLPHWSAEGVLGPGATLVPADWLERVSPWLLPVWAAGATAGGLVIVARLAWLAWLRSRCDVITEGTLADAAIALTAELRLPRPVTILRSDNASLLGTWGIDPKLVVPPHADSWSEERVRIVLRHELAHVRRHDWLILTAAESVRAIYWFNPLMWIAWRRLRDESEHACDAEVVRGGAIDGREYAAHLVDIARTLRPRAAWWPAAAMARRSTLERRVRAILDSARPAAPASRRAHAAVAAAALVLMLPLAVIGRPAPPREIRIPDPRGQKLTLLLDGRVVDLSQGWPPTEDPNAGLVPGPGQTLSVHSNR